MKQKEFNLELNLIENTLYAFLLHNYLLKELFANLN